MTLKLTGMDVPQAQNSNLSLINRKRKLVVIGFFFASNSDAAIIV
jgi:hypothetical protein